MPVQYTACPKVGFVPRKLSYTGTALKINSPICSDLGYGTEITALREEFEKLKTAIDKRENSIREVQSF